MIPEYESFKKQKDNLRDKYLKYLNETYLTDLDRKYQDYWVLTKKINIVHEYINTGSQIYSLDYHLWSEIKGAFTINLSESVPDVVGSLVNLKNSSPEFWEYLKKDITNYIKTVKVFIKKFDSFCDLLDESKLSITYIKTNFPELYEKYKSI